MKELIAEKYMNEHEYKIETSQNQPSVQKKDLGAEATLKGRLTYKKAMTHGEAMMRRWPGPQDHQ